jgi:CheY-like chemotaxis protein/HPt (histidine-containing phosphotransfer) domain-containing protein
LSNAVKYTKEGSVSLFVEGETDGEDAVLRFIVRDTGIGIKPEDVNRMFSEFTRVDTRNNRAVEGTGLGLAIVKRLCLAMGGDVAVESKYGKGSVFTAEIRQKVTRFIPFAAVEDTAGKRALVYENRPVYAESLYNSLSNLGIDCTVTQDEPSFARALIERGPYGFAFMPLALYAPVEGLLKARGKGVAPVLLTEFEEASQKAGVITVFSPAYAVPIANALNGGMPAAYYETRGVFVEFTAPDARVLAVDDLEMNLSVVEGLLSPYAMRLDLCESGKRAVAMIQDAAASGDNYDIVLLDHLMPEMDGLEAAAVIRRWETEHSAAPAVLVVLTANAISGMREMYLSRGFNDYLSKPIEIMKLNQLISRWIPADKKVKSSSGFALQSSAGLYFDLDGVDVRYGVEMTGGRVDGYKKLLAGFRRDSLLRTEALIKTEDAAAMRLAGAYAHAIKSASATLGAKELSQSAAGVEKAAGAGDVAMFNNIINGFRAELLTMCENIAVLLDEGGRGERDLNVKPVFRRIWRALAQGDYVKVDDMLAAARPALTNENDKELWERVYDKTLEADFDGARLLLENGGRD